MSLKKQQRMLATFSMASMTDVVFLLLVFFMVTSTFIFPTALEVNLPQSAEQTQLKPITRVYVLADGSLQGAYGDAEPMPLADDASLVMFLKKVQEQDPESGIAVYGDVEAAYGRVIEVLNLGAANDLKMVLATTPVPGNMTGNANGQPDDTAIQQ
ncbi:MAG: biopolymer transporter ExbD [Bacteroidales bacterium]|nr:biopolymer transporter ExbD [Bacteroidales bacterium]